MTVGPDVLKAIALRALELVPDGGVVGLGSGRAAAAFIHALALRVAQGLRVRGVATSQATEELARRLGIPLTSLDEVDCIDLDVDGADEVDPQGDLIKGFGGALVREKIVAASSRRLIILAGAEKLVPVLGSRGILPVEVVPFGLPLCRRELEALGCVPEARMQGGSMFITDNGNHILDCRVMPISRPAELEQAILAIPGTVGTGLFLGMLPTVIVPSGDTVEVRESKTI